MQTTTKNKQENDNSKIKASFPKNRPKCCGVDMYRAGGTVGEIVKGSVQYWRCEICNNETEDIAN